MLNSAQLKEALQAAAEPTMLTPAERRGANKLLASTGFVRRLHKALDEHTKERVVRAPTLASELAELFSSTTTTAIKAAERLCELYLVLPAFPDVRYLRSPKARAKKRRR